MDRPPQYFEDYVLNGETIIPATYAITEEEIIAMSAKWDPQPFHMDKEAAAQSIFGGLVASTAHLIPVFIWLAQQEGRKPAAIAGLGFDELRLLLPVRPRDVLSYRYITIEKRPSRNHPGAGIIVTHAQMFNQRGEVVMTAKVAGLVQMKDRSGNGVPG